MPVRWEGLFNYVDIRITVCRQPSSWQPFPHGVWGSPCLPAFFKKHACSVLGSCQNSGRVSSRLWQDPRIPVSDQGHHHQLKKHHRRDDRYCDCLAGCLLPLPSHILLCPPSVYSTSPCLLTCLLVRSCFYSASLCCVFRSCVGYAFCPCHLAFARSAFSRFAIPRHALTTVLSLFIPFSLVLVSHPTLVQ